MRALSDPNYRYFKLKKDLSLLKAGAIFFLDTDDTQMGLQGCLKLCWTPDGNCYRGHGDHLFCGDTVALHTQFLDDKKTFEEINSKDRDVFFNSLSVGEYKVVVSADGTRKVTKYGAPLR